jgi:diadenosine tetraphosphate (Ap4A) HIT family hydrolase
MVEVHNSPEKALSDGPQSLTLEEFAELMRHVQIISEAMKTLTSLPSHAGMEIGSEGLSHINIHQEGAIKQCA